jgi:hypothetical protein
MWRRMAREYQKKVEEMEESIIGRRLEDQLVIREESARDTEASRLRDDLHDKERLVAELERAVSMHKETIQQLTIAVQPY